MNTYNEIYLIREQIDDLFNTLTMEERVFVYYIFRAGLPFNKIYRDQNHRYSNEIIDMFQFLYNNKEYLEYDLLNDIKMYLVYLWTNNGPYFMREEVNNKRTPHILGLVHLTPDSLINVLNMLNYNKKYQHLLPTIFDNDINSNMVVNSSIEQSGNNYYGKGFTTEHYNTFPNEVKNRINAYFELDDNFNPIVNYYSCSGKYGEELKVTVHWLKLALEHTKKFTQTFDEHIPASLGLLIEYLETGNEEKFKQHSIEWLQTNSKLDYTLGFIETYHDPMGIRGQAGGEVTIKTVNMEKLNPILLGIEQRMPIPQEYKKSSESNIIMNVSMNKILFSSGDYGPQVITAAYCLPNYDDIRSTVGSKQVLYKLPDSVESSLNPELAKQFRTTSRQNFIEKYDNNDEICDDLWDVQVLLHETVGHGSGQFHEHIFTENEHLIINNIKYNIGDTIPVTDANYSEFISKDSSALEELRAEINALYMSVTEIDVLTENGVFKNWLNILGKEELQKQCIMEMCNHMFRRLFVQSADMTDIVGAHARANVVITNYLLDGLGIDIKDETKNIDGTDYHLLEIEVIDLEKTFNSILELVNIVQKIKSTGDTNGCKELFGKYTTYPVTIERAKLYREYMLDKKQKLVGNIKATSRIFPNYRPVIMNDVLIDSYIGNEMDVFEQNMYYDKLMLSTNLCYNQIKI